MRPLKSARVNAVRESAVPMWYFPLDSTPTFVGSMHVRATGNPEVLAETLIVDGAVLDEEALRFKLSRDVGFVPVEHGHGSDSQ